MICFIMVKLLSHPFYSITFLRSLGTGHQLPFIKTNEKPLLKFFLTLEEKVGDLVKFIEFFSFDVECHFQIHTIKTPKYSACIFPCITPETRLVQLVS